MKQKTLKKIWVLLVLLMMPSLVMANSPSKQQDTIESVSVQLCHQRCGEIYSAASCENRDSIALSLWLLNTDLLKDAFDHVVFPSHGNENFLITSQFVKNALRINNLYNRRANNKDIQHLLVKQFFILQAYILALKLDHSLSAINLKLLSSNKELALAFKKALDLDKSEAARVELALIRRLASLKELGEAYVEAYFTDEFENVYVKYSRALVAATKLEMILNRYVK